MSTTFLSARWRHLIMLNYAVDPALLEPIVPRGTRLDMHDGQCWVSVVAFLFLDTKVLGLPVPGHRDFEELNLRFYVRRDVPDTDRGQPFRRGVAFVKEVVPRFAIATVARMLYNENYVALPMSHMVARQPGAGDVGDDLRLGDRVHIGFRQRGTTPEWGEVAATVAAAPGPCWWAPMKSSSPSTTGAMRGSGVGARWSTRSTTQRGGCTTSRMWC